MRYRLRTLLILFLFATPITYGAWQATIWARGEWLAALKRGKMVYQPDPRPGRFRIIAGPPADERKTPHDSREDSPNVPRSAR
jgi:hypothetical protein